MFSMPWVNLLAECPQGKAESLHRAFFIDDVDDATGIQRIEAEVMYGNRYVGSDRLRAYGFFT
jgi:hypothetical protein